MSAGRVVLSEQLFGAYRSKETVHDRQALLSLQLVVAPSALLWRRGAEVRGELEVEGLFRPLPLAGWARLRLFPTTLGYALSFASEGRELSLRGRRSHFWRDPYAVASTLTLRLESPDSSAPLGTLILRSDLRSGVDRVVRALGLGWS